MSYSAEAKLHELRNKTNRELVSLIGNKLNHGLASVRVLDSGDGVDDWEWAEPYVAGAEAAWAEATRWMTLLADATPYERRRLEFKCTQLRAALDRVHALETRVRAAC
ncbi:MAG TPA: hypothetical protein VMB03_01225 [Bryobacteraceae bacterium]|nr:hypothetical protein [Bryobacteraceae bacterium]